eukprot:1362219-Lingulodinium_polyedra.AAC.1
MLDQSKDKVIEGALGAQDAQGSGKLPQLGPLEGPEGMPSSMLQQALGLSTLVQDNALPGSKPLPIEQVLAGRAHWLCGNHL